MKHRNELCRKVFDAVKTSTAMMLKTKPMKPKINGTKSKAERHFEIGSSEDHDDSLIFIPDAKLMYRSKSWRGTNESEVLFIFISHQQGSTKLYNEEISASIAVGGEGRHSSRKHLVNGTWRFSFAAVVIDFLSLSLVSICVLRLGCSLFRSWCRMYSSRALAIDVCQLPVNISKKQNDICSRSSKWNCWATRTTQRDNLIINYLFIYPSIHWLISNRPEACWELCFLHLQMKTPFVIEQRGKWMMNKTSSSSRR